MRRLVADLLIVVGFPLALSGCATAALWGTTQEPAANGFEVVVSADDVQPRYVDWRSVHHPEELDSGRLELGSDACAEHVFIEHLRKPPDNKIAPGEMREIWARSTKSFSLKGMVLAAKLAPCETLLTVLRFDETRTTSLVAVEASGHERGRVDIKQPRLPHPLAWPLIPVAAAVDVVTFPLQLPFLLYLNTVRP